MIYFKVMKEKELIGIGSSEENDVSMYNDKFQYVEITKKQFEKLEKEFYVINKHES